jgi:hypothetical protein
MVVHALAAVIMIVAAVVGVIVAVSGSINTGIVIAVVGVGAGLILALLNFLRVLRNPDKF